MMKERLKKLESGESAAVATEQRKCATLHGRIEEMRTEIKDRSGRENDLVRGRSALYITLLKSV